MPPSAGSLLASDARLESFGLDCNEISAVRSHCIPGVQLGQALALWLGLQRSGVGSRPTLSTRSRHPCGQRPLRNRGGWLGQVGGLEKHSKGK